MWGQLNGVCARENEKVKAVGKGMRLPFGEPCGYIPCDNHSRCNDVMSIIQKEKCQYECIQNTVVLVCILRHSGQPGHTKGTWPE